MKSNQSNLPMLVFMTIPAFFALVMFYKSLVKPAYELISHDRLPATVTSCVAKTVKSTTRYAPVATTETGEMVTGDLYLPKNACTSNIGDQITVLVNPGDRSSGSHLTFMQFWMLPSIVIAFLLIVMSVYLARKRRSRS